MIHRFVTGALVGLALVQTSAAGALEEARESIKKAAGELLSTQKEYSDLRLGLYREVNRLDDEVVKLAKELRTLERDEELRTSKVRSLEREIETRKTDVTYASDVLAQYSKAVVTRLHPAESQLYKQAIENADQKAMAAGDPKSVVAERFKILETGLARLGEVAGGHRFGGKALGRAGQAIEGTLLLAGPSVLFASLDKSFEGVASSADTGANLAAIVPLAETNGSIAKAIETGEGDVPLDATNGRAIEQALKNPEGSHGGGAMEHVALFGDIAKNMMFDGWIAIGICVLMIATGWTVAVRKFFYLNKVQKGTEEFMHRWSQLSSDLTAIDHGDPSSIKSLGGNADNQAQELLKKSPLYEIYHIGSEEIRHRLQQDRIHKKGLSGRSMQAIRAALDAGLVRAQHKLTNGLIYLTISIAGGPYVGLLGTVVGVMITFAIISKVGEVDVNAIAPGIASALLATVAGLIVAIPALFAYSYLNSRIKNVVGEMQVFIDEFIAKMAELYQGSDHPNAAQFAAAEKS
jgi:biopolymer transport protein ExbB/TolQ